ncbi:hypothetical protein LV178_09315, partial [Burkholderia mallei]|nr:hypothetical protein [Burkholderia mallei]
MQRTSSSSWASNVARVVMWRDPRAGGKRKVTVRDELAGDGAGRGRSRVRLRGRPRDGARMRRTPVRQTLQRWRPNAVRKFAAVRAGTASAAYAANAGATSVAALAAECRSQVRSGSRTNGICRWRLPLAVAVRPAHSTRRCVAPRRIARFAAEPLSRRPRAEGGAPNPQP